MLEEKIRDDVTDTENKLLLLKNSILDKSPVCFDQYNESPGMAFSEDRPDFRNNSYFDYILENQILENKSIVLKNSSILIANSTLVKINIIIEGNRNCSTLFRKCIFRSSKIVIDSALKCTIESCYFIAKDISMNEESHHMLTVSETYYLYVWRTEFNSSDKDMIKTQLAIKMTNVAHSEISCCLFSNIRSEKWNSGAVLHITSSKIYTTHTQVISCAGKIGVIFATSDVEMTNVNLSFISNSAKEGFGDGGIYMTYGSTMTNMHCTFRNNIVHSGTLHLRYNVKCINIDTSFISNAARWMGGSIYIANRVNLTNINSSFISNSAHIMGGALYSRNSFTASPPYNRFTTVCLNTNCKFLNNTSRFHGGALRFEHSRNILFSKCTFIHNKVILGQGGAGFIVHCRNIEIRNSKFTMNTARNGAGALLIRGQDDQKIIRMNVSITDSFFSENRSPSSGAAIYFLAKSRFHKQSYLFDVFYSLISCKFSSNSGI